MTNAEKDLMNYLNMLSVIESHLATAMSVSVGIFLTNPDNRGVPSLDDFMEDVDVIRRNVVRAKEIAQDRLDNPESPNV